MRAIRHVTRVVVSTLRYAVASRSPSLLLVIALGLAMVAVALAATAAAPIALYPFL